MTEHNGYQECSDGRIPTIKEYCDHKRIKTPYLPGVKPDSCYDRPQDADGTALMVFEWQDWVVIGVYFVIILVTGLSVSYSGRKKSKNTTDFLLAGRSMSFIPIGCSLFSSDIGAGHFIGVSGAAAAAGIAVAHFEFNAMICLLLLGWLFVPVYLASGISTMPEFLRRRFPGGRIRMYLATLSLFVYIFTKISADLYAGSLFITLAIPSLNIYLAISGLLVITVVYAIAGGLKAVIYVESLQTIVMVVGSTVLAVLAFGEIASDQESGWESLWAKYNCSIPADYEDSSQTDTGETCGGIRSDFDHIFRDPINSDLPWPGAIFGLTIISTWYWCTDQVIVQRTLAAKDLSNAKIGCVMAGVLKIAPMFIIVIPGMISRILFTDEVACVSEEKCINSCQSALSCSNIAYPTLILRILPTGLRGLLMAVMLAALMSSLTATFNSGATLFTLDIYNKIRPTAKQRELMIVSRCTMLALCGVSILWLPIVQNSSDGLLFDYIQSITSYLGPPVVTVFTMGIFWERMNESGAFWGLIGGLVIGCCRMLNEFIFSKPRCGFADSRPVFVIGVHYLYFGILLAGITVVISASISLLTPPIDRRYLYRLTWWTRFSTAKRLDIEIESSDRKNRRRRLQNKTTVDCEANEETTGTSKISYDPVAVIRENKNWNIAANAIAVFSVIVSVFLHGYFA